MLWKQDKKRGVSCISELFFAEFEEDDQFLEGEYETYLIIVGIKKGIQWKAKCSWARA